MTDHFKTRLGVFGVGDVVHIGSRCGVQFQAGRDLFLRVITIEESASWDGMAFLTGYVLNQVTGDAIEKRTVYVIVAGVRAIIPFQRTVVIPGPRPAAPRIPAVVRR